MKIRLKTWIVISFNQLLVSKYLCSLFISQYFDVVDYTRIANPTDRTPDVDIRHAMSNYFSTKKFSNKMNLLQ